MNLDEFYSLKSNLGLMWMGNDGWILNLWGTIIATDLDLHSQDRVSLPANVDIVKMAGHIQAVFISHEHGDHFNPDTCLFLQNNSDCLFVIPKNCYREAVKIGLSDERLIIATPRIPFQLLGLNIQPVRALHGHYLGSVFREANLDDCGYIIGKDDFSLYQPGDTVLLDEHFDMKNIDVLFFSPTEHNMHIDNSVHFIQMIKPRFIVPQHYDSYKVTPENAFWTRGFPDDVYNRLTDTERSSFIKLPQGQPKRLSFCPPGA